MEVVEVVPLGKYGRQTWWCPLTLKQFENSSDFDQCSSDQLLPYLLSQGLFEHLGEEHKAATMSYVFEYCFKWDHLLPSLKSFLGLTPEWFGIQFHKADNHRRIVSVSLEDEIFPSNSGFQTGKKVPPPTLLPHVKEEKYFPHQSYLPWRISIHFNIYCF